MSFAFIFVKNIFDVKILKSKTSLVSRSGNHWFLKKQKISTHLSLHRYTKQALKLYIINRLLILVKSDVSNRIKINFKKQWYEKISPRKVYMTAFSLTKEWNESNFIYNSFLRVSSYWALLFHKLVCNCKGCHIYLSRTYFFISLFFKVNFNPIWNITFDQNQ